jgi:hypothetical protein
MLKASICDAEFKTDSRLRSNAKILLNSFRNDDTLIDLIYIILTV